MAETFEILDDDDKYRKNCPLGIRGVCNQNKPLSIHEMKHEDQLKWAYKVLTANNAKPKHGDVIWIGGEVYRNEGIHFWDAKNNKIIPMETKISDYGHVPEIFKIGKGEGEFCSTHWNGISYYNNLEPYWSSKRKAWYYPSECAYQSGSETDSE